MNRKLNNKTSKAGFTLVEVLITIGIFAVIIIAVGAFESNIFIYRNSISASLENVQDAQIILKTMSGDLREAQPGANGAYALVTTGTSTISFFSDSNNNGKPQLITYTLIGNQIYRAILPPSGSPAIYLSANQSTTTLVVNVRNASSSPVFEYFDANYNGTSTPLVQPVTTTSVRLVKINLTLDVDPNRSPLPITYTSQVSFRNLKTNL